MQQTENYNLQLYEPNDMANLLDGYNDSMETLDVALKGIVDDEKARFPINTIDIANGAVTTDKISTAAVTGEKIASNAVDTAQIANEAVTGEKIASNAVDTAQIANEAVINEKIANGTIELNKIAPAAIDNIVTQGSNNLVTNDAVYDALSAIRQLLVFAPTKLNLDPASTIPTNANFSMTMYANSDNSLIKPALDIRITNNSNETVSYDLTAIPGGSTYGFLLCDVSQFFDTISSPISYNTICTFTIRNQTTLTTYASVPIVVGTDRKLYISYTANASGKFTIPAFGNATFLITQILLTTNNYNIEPAIHII